MQPGDVQAGIIAGLDGAADWVDDARAGRIDPVLLVEQLPRVIEHLTVYLAHEIAQVHASRQRWLNALKDASEL